MKFLMFSKAESWSSGSFTLSSNSLAIKAESSPRILVLTSYWTGLMPLGLVLPYSYSYRVLAGVNPNPIFVSSNLSVLSWKKLSSVISFGMLAPIFRY